MEINSLSSEFFSKALIYQTAFVHEFYQASFSHCEYSFVIYFWVQFLWIDFFQV